jgi:hypothetical protein
MIYVISYINSLNTRSTNPQLKNPKLKTQNSKTDKSKPKTQNPKLKTSLPLQFDSVFHIDRFVASVKINDDSYSNGSFGSSNSDNKDSEEYTI